MRSSIPFVTYDIAVIGGGRAGAAAARMLAAGGCRTLLVDRPGRRRMGESLPPAARTLLGELGAWDRFQTDGHLPCYGNESLWGSSTVHSTDFIRTPYGHGCTSTAPASIRACVPPPRPPALLYGRTPRLLG